jgi:hypothetical protein
MREPGCPPFFEVLTYLICMVLSFGLIGWILIWISVGKTSTVPFEIVIYLFALAVIIVYSGFRLVKGLFPARFSHCPMCSLLKEIIEIDGTVR